jgi:poly(3-hydroxybutyrate) depolymerase
MRAITAVLTVVAAASAGVAPVKLIIDTDIGGGGCKDVDDVAAVCIGNALADNGEVELLATVVNTKPPKCPGVVSVLNSWYGRGDSVPIGSYKGADLPEGEHLPYVDDLPDHFPSTVKNASQVPDAVEVYRRVLAAQPDGSVTISSIGLHTNLRALLLSPADAHSSLGGRDLVAAKVKALWVMGGKYPTSVGTGFAECNVAGGGGADHPTGAAASSYVAAHWPAESQLVWSGFDVGGPVKCAGQLATCAPASNPCRQAFLDTTKGNAHASFDPLTTLAAVRGPEAVGTAFCTDCDGTNVIDATSGDNTWKAGPASNQSYLVLKDATAAGAALDKLLCQPPAHPPAPTPPPPTAAVARFVLSSSDQQITLTVGGHKRLATLHLPPAAAAAAAAAAGVPPLLLPLVFNWHAMMETKADQQGLADMDRVADAAGFAVVYPQGFSAASVVGYKLGGFTHNAGGCCSSANADGVDDVAFARALLEYVAVNASAASAYAGAGAGGSKSSAAWAIDRRRVFSAGFSNGGFMSNRLACEAPDAFAAVAAVSGILAPEPNPVMDPKGAPFACAPGRPVPVLHVHGTEDRLVAYNGNPDFGWDGVQAYADGWSARNGCTELAALSFANASASASTAATTAAAATNTSVRCMSRCGGMRNVTLCTVQGGGHAWPAGRCGGAFGPCSLNLGPIGTLDVVGEPLLQTADEIWRFFSDKTLA